MLTPHIFRPRNETPAPEKRQLTFTQAATPIGSKSGSQKRLRKAETQFELSYAIQMGCANTAAAYVTAVKHGGQCLGDLKGWIQRASETAAAWLRWEVRLLATVVGVMWRAPVLSRNSLTVWFTSECICRYAGAGTTPRSKLFLCATARPPRRANNGRPWPEIPALLAAHGPAYGSLG